MAAHSRHQADMRIAMTWILRGYSTASIGMGMTTPNSMSTELVREERATGAR